MTCHECFEAFSSALDGELDPELQGAMNSHLEDCADCRHLRARMLDLSAELKAQPFPTPDESAAREMARTATEMATTVSWGWLRRFLRFPYENWLPRFFFRGIAVTTMLALLVQTLLVRFVLSAYTGVEAVGRSGLGGVNDWTTWYPGVELLQLASLLVLILGSWTCGVPGLMTDLWSGTRLVKRDLLWLGTSLLLLGPVAALPLLGGLRLGHYLFALCLWAGLCMMGTFLLVAFKTQRSLPKLVLDFVGLSLLIALLEMCARASLQVDWVPRGQELFHTLVGNFSFPFLLTHLGAVTLGVILLLPALWGLPRAYRSGGGRPAALVAGLVAVGSLYYGAQPLQNAVSVSTPDARASAGKKAYILGSRAENPWILAGAPYPQLELGNSDYGSPRGAALQVSGAFLTWREEKILTSFEEWARNAQGVCWGLSQLLDSVGQRRKGTLLVTTERGRKAVSQLLQELRLRRLNDVVLSAEQGVLEGRFLADSGAVADLPLRLIPVQSESAVGEGLNLLGEEAGWASDVASSGRVTRPFPSSLEHLATTDSNGNFRFAHLPKGRYLLAFLKDGDPMYTLNSSVPGVISLGDGDRKNLDTIRLTTGREGSNVDLSQNRWETAGTVSFSGNSELTTARLAPGSTMTGFVDTKLFAGGKAIVKLLSTSDSPPDGTVSCRFFTRDGRFVREWKRELSDQGFDELRVDTRDVEGYLQLVVRAGQSSLTVKQVRVELLSSR